MVHDPSAIRLSGVSARLVLLTLIALTSCTIPIRNVALPPAPCPDVTPEIWISADDPPERYVCAQIFSTAQPLWRVRCLTVGQVRAILAAYSPAN